MELITQKLDLLPPKPLSSCIFSTPTEINDLLINNYLLIINHTN